MKCYKCNDSGIINSYHDAGDHFGACTSPFSEWIEVPCPDCRCVKCGKPNKDEICNHCGAWNKQHDSGY